MARGIALIAVAVVLGVVLLAATDSPEPFAGRPVVTDDEGSSTDASATPDTTAPPVTATTHDPATVTVLVANGARIPRLASRITEQLKAQNFLTAEPTDTIEAADTSGVYFTAGYEADAAAIAALLSPPPATAPLPDPAPVEDLRGAHVLVVAAADLASAAG